MASTTQGSRHFLAAIDGTDSADWRRPDGSNSHVHAFYRDFAVPETQKHYFDGPDTPGLQVPQIANTVLNWLLQAVGRQGPVVPHLHREPIGLFTSQTRLHVAPLEARIDQRDMCIAGAGEAPFVVSLVGHSRGGLIAITVARSLACHGVRVHFLGLYDAVDRAIQVDGERITNVDHTVHARRHPAMNSRSTFGNTGTESAGDYDQRFFLTSHGGIGGSPEMTPSGVTSDYACDIRGLSAGIEKALGGDRGRTCTGNALLADSYVRDAARRYGLPLR